MLIDSNRVLCSSSLYNRRMTMITNTGYEFVRLGAAALFLALSVAGCTVQKNVVESSPQGMTEGDASVAVANAQETAPAGNEVGGATPEIPPAEEELPPPVDEQAPAQKQAPTYNTGDVIWIQQRLKDLGYYEGPVDGSVGSATRNAVIEYQRDQDVTADGKPTSELREFMWLNGG